LVPSGPVADRKTLAAGLEFRVGLGDDSRDQQQTLTVTGPLKPDVSALTGAQYVEPESQPAATAQFLNLMRRLLVCPHPHRALARIVARRRAIPSTDRNIVGVYT